MRIVLTKRPRGYEVSITERTGENVRFDFPAKTAVPHDAVHYLVEDGLKLQRGFWGLVHSGTDPQEIALLAKVGGHPSANRPGAPSRDIVELIQAERLVECFEASIDSETINLDTLYSVYSAACTTSLVEPIDLDDEAVSAIHKAVVAFRDQWTSLEIEGTQTLIWPGPRAASAAHHRS